MKTLSPSEWAKLSKEGLGLGDVITMAYVNKASLSLEMDTSNDISPSDFDVFPSPYKYENHTVDALKYAIGARVFRSSGDDFFELADGPVLFEEESFGGFASDLPKAPTKKELLNLYVPHGMIRINSSMNDEDIKNIKESMKKKMETSRPDFKVPIIGDLTSGIEPFYSNHYVGKGHGKYERVGESCEITAKFDDPVFKNTLPEFMNSQLKTTGKGWEPETKQCDCGAQKTYGKDCKASFHSSWCSIK